MTQVSHSRPSQSGGGTSAPSPALPDLNAETYPFEVVQRLLDEAAFFNLFSAPDQRRPGGPIAAPGRPGGVVGFRIAESLHRFDIGVEPPTSSGLRAALAVGEPLASFQHRWMFIPPDFKALPDREPPPTLLDPSRSQRFVLLDGVCRFGGGDDGFRGFGSGLTFPVTRQGTTEIHAAAVGTLLEGFGRFRGHQGTYTYCGTLSPDRGFTGSLLLRVMDPEGHIRTLGTLPASPRRVEPEAGTSYILFRGQKRDRNQKTAYVFDDRGQVVGLDVEQELRLFTPDAAIGRDGVQTTGTVGAVIGQMTAKIGFNLLNPGAPGTQLSPVPFQSFNDYTFFDRDGRPIGGFAADGFEGRTFNVEFSGAPGQRGLRFGGFGPLLNGTGPFAGIQGLMTDNSVVGIAPHALSTLYVLRIHDPEGRYRAAFAGVGR
jgi:hypothetical protein